jgi:hypothetical protein
MHGAALTHAVFLPPWAGVVELWPNVSHAAGTFAPRPTAVMVSTCTSSLPGACACVMEQAADPQWRCFEHFSRLSGHKYTRWANQDPAQHVQNSEGDFTHVDVDQLVPIVTDMIMSTAVHKLGAQS